MIILDTNIIVDLLEADSVWLDWSRRAVLTAGASDALSITHIVLAELHARPDAGRFVRQKLAAAQIAIDPFDDAISERAGQAHGLYRSRGGSREAILADFLIGAHAAIRNAALITRDRQRFASYFPELTIIAPETHP